MKIFLEYIVFTSRKKYFFLQMNVCFKSLFSNLQPNSGFKLLSEERALILATVVVWTRYSESRIKIRFICKTSLGRLKNCGYMRLEQNTFFRISLRKMLFGLSSRYLVQALLIYACYEIQQPAIFIQSSTACYFQITIFLSK